MSTTNFSDAPSLTLSIVQLDQSIDQLGDRPIIADMVALLLDQLSCSTPHEANSEASRCPTSTALREKVEKSILRYRRDQDRWTSLTSLLLKSLAFYRSLDPSPVPLVCSSPSLPIPATGEDDDTLSTQLDKKLEITTNNNNDKKKNILPIVDLPRTKYNRPYLPMPDDKKSIIMHSSASCSRSKEDTIVHENYNSMMNVSHQYPWVCMVQKTPQGSITSSKHKDDSLLLVGIDVVIFNARLNNYTPTISEFLQSFVQSFTPWEWERITTYHCNKQCNNSSSASSSILSSWLPGRNKKSTPTTHQPRRSDESKLREFFLRWSMKEAYTKARGMGMHLNFDEFETKLLGIDDYHYHQDENNTINNKKKEGITMSSSDDGEQQEEDEEEGIWTSIMKKINKENADSNNNDVQTNTTIGKKQRHQHQLSVIGKVKHITNSSSASSSSSELWEFIFVPLDNNNNIFDSSGSSDHHEEATTSYCCDACACICRGPLRNHNETRPHDVSIEPLTLGDLIQVHGSNPI